MKKRTLLVAAVGVVVFTLFAGAMPAIAPAQPKDVIRWKGRVPAWRDFRGDCRQHGWMAESDEQWPACSCRRGKHSGSIVPVQPSFDAVSTGCSIMPTPVLPSPWGNF